MYDTPYRPPTQFSVFPPVIKNVLIINVLAFIAQLTPLLGIVLIKWFALWPIGTPSGLPHPQGFTTTGFWPWQLVTYGFLHSTSGFGHILFNMFMLWMFGVQIENVWGSKRFGIYYIVCVIGAAVAQLAVATLYPQIYYTVGASGGVMGVLLAFGMTFPEQRIYLYFLVPIRAKYLVMGLAAFELFAGISGQQPGVANFAHLGGMLIGLVLILYWRGKLPLPSRRSAYSDRYGD